jgi:hypothetical protein
MIKINDEGQRSAGYGIPNTHEWPGRERATYWDEDWSNLQIIRPSTVGCVAMW